jgi:hypothetical protein
MSLRVKIRKREGKRFNFTVASFGESGGVLVMERGGYCMLFSLTPKMVVDEEMRNKFIDDSCTPEFLEEYGP